MSSKFNPNKHHRKSLRAPGHNYTQPGAYFVTIVTYQRECLFGEVPDGVMRLNENGQIVQWEWERLTLRFAFLELGTYIVRPNHTHGILIFHGAVRATRADYTVTHSNNAPLQTNAPDDNNGSPLPRGPKPSSLGTVIGQFKSRVTKRLWKIPDLNGIPIWQRNYYDHIIRNNGDLKRIHRYIEANPHNWDTDQENTTPRAR